MSDEQGKLSAGSDLAEQKSRNNKDDGEALEVVAGDFNDYHDTGPQDDDLSKSEKESGDTEELKNIEKAAQELLDSKDLDNFIETEPPLEDTAASGSKSKKKHRLTIAAGVLGVCFFACGGYFLYNAIGAIMQGNNEEIILDGLHALEENELDSASNRFASALEENKNDVIAADYLAWIEARKGNFDKTLEYARISIADEENSGSFELMGYLSLLGKGKAIGAEAAWFYFQKALSKVPTDLYEPHLRQILSRAIYLCQSRQDYLFMLNKGAKAGLAEAILLKGDAEFLGEGLGVSPKAALMSWTDARRAGDSRSLVRIAMMKWYGYGGVRDLDEALDLLREAARRKVPEAMYDLAIINLRRDSAKSISEGIKLMGEAADLGYGPALTAMGILTLQASLDETSRRAAWIYFENALRHNDITGSVFYSFMLYSGLGVAKADKHRARAILYELRRRGIKSANGIYEFLSYNGDNNSEKALEQMAWLCGAQLYGDVSFDDGDPYAFDAYSRLSAIELKSYYLPMRQDLHISKDRINWLGLNYITYLRDPADVRINKQKLYSKAFTQLLEVYNPTLGARYFEPRLVEAIVTDAPALPSRFDEYPIDFRRINAWAAADETSNWMFNL